MPDMPTSDAEVMPMEPSGSAGSAGVSGNLSFLTADWVNTRINNVVNKVDAILSKIIDFGLLADGYAPFESPITDDMLIRMTPEQFRALYDSEPSLDGKAALLQRLATLKLPPREELPRRESASSPAPKDKLAFSAFDQVPSSQS